MNNFKLDRTAFRIASFKEAENTRFFWLSQPPLQRLEAAWHLICRAYNLDPAKVHRLDRTKFYMKKR